MRFLNHARLGGERGENRKRSSNKLSEVKESKSKYSNKKLAALCLFKIHDFNANLEASGAMGPEMGCSPNKPVPHFSLMCLYIQSQDSLPPKVSSSACGR